MARDNERRSDAVEGFFSKVEEVTKLWHEVLGADFLVRPRLSRIYYRQRFFYYPIRPVNVLWHLGPWQGLLIVLSYLRWQLFPHRHEDSFEQWVTNRFGRRLFLTFFSGVAQEQWSAVKVRGARDLRRVEHGGRDVVDRMAAQHPARRDAWCPAVRRKPPPWSLSRRASSRRASSAPARSSREGRGPDHFQNRS